MAGSISDPLAETESHNCYKHASVIMSCSIYLSISTYYPLCLAGHAESGTSLRAPAPVRDDGARRRRPTGRVRARYGAADRWRAVVSVEATSLSNRAGSLPFSWLHFTRCFTCSPARIARSRIQSVDRSPLALGHDRTTWHVLVASKQPRQQPPAGLTCRF